MKFIVGLLIGALSTGMAKALREMIDAQKEYNRQQHSLREWQSKRQG